MGSCELFFVFSEYSTDIFEVAIFLSLLVLLLVLPMTICCCCAFELFHSIKTALFIALSAGKVDS
uniref:Hydrophobic protein n=1 Tax=Ascaris lumbricoides TaxID=6252 RepID=A0A0M3HZU2_ASCLU